MNSIKNFLASGVLLLGLSSCGGNKETEVVEEATTVDAAKDTTPYTADDTTKFKFDFAIANIPSPANTVQEFVKWGVTYDNGILNDPKKADNYSTEYLRSINLGIYNIDMAYAMVSDKGTDVLQLMKGILKISEGLGLKGAVDMMVGKRAEVNLSNKDSLFSILDEIFVKSDTYLRTNERVYTASNIFAGSWLETLYLTCKISEQVNDPNVQEAARRHLWEQRFYLGNLIQLLDDFKDKKECAELLSKLRPIHEEINVIKKPSDLNNDNFKSISEKIYALRNQFTK